MSESTSILHSIPVDELTGAISVPIYQTSTFVQEAPGVNKGYDYARTANPTRKALENLVAKLENGHTGCAFASGLAAIDGVVKLLSAGDEILAVDDLYGGAFRLFTQIYSRFGISMRYVDTSDIGEVINGITPKTRLIWLESPTNPTLKVSDIAAIARVATQKNILVCVDNTFASPASQKPIDLGADIVIHSATKYLGGHSDLIAGVVITKSAEIGERVRFIQNASGAILSPFDSWLVIRGIETLPLRVRQHAENAQAVAEFLETVPEVDSVFYPGLPNHRNHEIARKQQRYFGGIVSFTLVEDTEASATSLATSTQLFKLAESLGGVKSLLCHPAAMTHKSIPADIRRKSGVADSLIRLSVGLEDAADLIEDLSQAFERLRKIKKSVTTNAVPA
jgi:cystathionine beta-lyase